jgi:hypothetical protein
MLTSREYGKWQKFHSFFLAPLLFIIIIIIIEGNFPRLVRLLESAVARKKAGGRRNEEDFWD